MFRSFIQRFALLPLEYFYLVLALGFGLFMVFQMPPFQVMDEYNHFYKAYALSEGEIFCTKNEQNKSGMYIPKNVLNAGQIMGVDTLAYHADNKILPEDIQKGGSVYIDENTQVFAESPFCESPAWSTIPQALGILLAKLFGLSLLGVFYFGRLFNLLAAVSIIFFALRKLPFGKPVFAFVALLPMFVQQISSYSLDALHYALLFFFYAYTLHLAYRATDEKYSYKELSLFLLFSLFAIHAKIGFIFLIFFIFLLPKKKFASGKIYALFMSSFVILHVLFLVLLRNLFHVDAFITNSLVNREEQMVYILTHPIKFIETIIYSVNTFFDVYWKNLFGILGWMDYPLYNVHYLLLLVLLFFILHGQDEKVPLDGKSRWFLGALFVLASMMLFAILYMLDDAVGSPLISFMQGKYLLPIFPLLLLSFYHLRVKREYIVWIISLVTIISCIATGMALRERYYDSFSVPLVKSSSGFSLQEITPRSNAFQTFRATEDNFRGVSLYIPRFTQKTDSPVKIILRDERCVAVLQSKDMNTANLSAEGFYTIDMDVISASKGQKYCINVYPSALHSTIPLLLQSSNNDEYPEGTLKVGKEVQPGDLRMKIIYKKSSVF